MNNATEKNTKAYDTMANSWEVAMSTNYGHSHLEKPAMDSLLPATLTGKKVLAIGVGSAGELKEILQRNPDKIIGIDISDKLLNIARKKYPSITFIKMDMMDMSFEDDSFDFVYSSLTFHYANDWDMLLSGVSRILTKKGSLLFSTHNPAYWALKSKTGETYTNTRGITLVQHTASLPGDVTILYYNHPNIDSIVDALTYCGFMVTTILNPNVVNIDQENNALVKLDIKNKKIPLFLIVSAIKK